MCKISNFNKLLKSIILVLLVQFAWSSSIPTISKVNLSDNPLDQLCQDNNIRFDCYFRQITYNKKLSQYIAVGAYGNTTAHASIQISNDDSINWNTVTNVTDIPARLSAIASKNGKLVVIGKDYSTEPGKIISLISEDSFNWDKYDTVATENAVCLVGIDWSLTDIVVVGLKDLPADPRYAGYSQYAVQVLNSLDGVRWNTAWN